MDNAEKMILMAVVGKAQGLSGQMRLKFFSETAEALRRYPHFYDKNGAEYEVAALDIRQGLPFIAFAGVESRSQAEQMAGVELFVKRSQLPDIAEADEFYQEDLLGFAVYDETGAHIGAVSGFFNFGGGDVLEIMLLPAEEEALPRGKNGEKSAKAKKALIPFSKAAVPQVELSARRLVLERRAAGLLPLE